MNTHLIIKYLEEIEKVIQQTVNNAKVLNTHVIIRVEDFKKLGELIYK
jgi:hypothetical protein